MIRFAIGGVELVRPVEQGLSHHRTAIRMRRARACTRKVYVSTADQTKDVKDASILN